nr:ribosome biogenesis protein BOP1 [Pelodiscus sinensis]|eukprot:XP_025043455.1 ribosome biogenesis protein BOP1 [Pelodiscus sinensis]
MEEHDQGSDGLTDSEESVYSGLEDSGSDSSSEEEAAEDQDSGAEGELKGGSRSKAAQARKEQVPGMSRSVESGSSLPLQDEYEEDSSDEEVGASSSLLVLVWVDVPPPPDGVGCPESPRCVL